MAQIAADLAHGHPFLQQMGGVTMTQGVGGRIRVTAAGLARQSEDFLHRGAADRFSGLAEGGRMHWTRRPGRGGGEESGGWGGGRKRLAWDCDASPKTRATPPAFLRARARSDPCRLWRCGY